MLRTLLVERLALNAHRDIRRMSGYILSLAKDGPQIKETGPPTPTNDPGSHIGRLRPGFSGAQLAHGSIPELANYLAEQLQAPVEDHTGLKGHYFILIEIPTNEMKDQFDRPALFRTALSAFGLHLAADKVDAPILVIDNLSKTPASN